MPKPTSKVLLRYWWYLAYNIFMFSILYYQVLKAELIDIYHDIDKLNSVNSCLHKPKPIIPGLTNQRRIQGGLWGISPLDQWNLLISLGFQAHIGAELPWNEKKLSPPPGQIPEYAPAYNPTSVDFFSTFFYLKKIHLPWLVSFPEE